MKYLLDSNVCIAALRGHSHVQARLSALSPGDCAVSTVTLYELLAGAARCRVPEREKAKVGAFVAPLHLLPFDHAAAARTADVRWNLEKRGPPIGPYDLMLAGQALLLDLTLVTHNLREFTRVDGLRSESWQPPV